MMNVVVKKVLAFLAVPFSMMLFMDGMYEENGLLMAECVGLFIVGVWHLFPVRDVVRRVGVYLSSLKVKRRSVFEKAV